MKSLLTLPISILIAALVILAGFLSINSAYQNKTITVTGEAQKQEQNQVATFSAGVYTVNEDKQTALDEVNTNIEEIISAVKEFGIPDKDIKTENLSIYQEENIETRQPGDWRASNNISVTLRDIERAEELARILTEGGATNVYGPSFTVEQSNLNKNELYLEALKNAQQKAQNMAAGLNAEVGRALHITEGTSSNYIPFEMDRASGMGGGGGPALEPGSTNVNATVTVVYELKY